MFLARAHRIFTTTIVPTIMTVALAACGGGGGSTTPPPAPTPTVTLSLSTGTAAVTAGQSTTVTANIVRGGGFTGAVTIAATGAPSGVTVTGGTIDAAATSQTITITTTAGAAIGAANLSITGTGTGVAITPVTLALTVNAAPSATLSLSAATATVLTGDSTTVTASITRSGGFTGAVTIAATGAPSGVTITGGTIASGSTSQVITIAATAGATLGNANISVTATATGVTMTPAALTLTVNAPPVGQLGNRIDGEAAGDQADKVAMSADGSRVVIGALLNDGMGNNAGHARVYQRSGNVWTQLGADLDGEAAEDRFGGAVAMSNNGNRIAIGSYLNDGGATNAGMVRVFDLVGGAWVQVGADIDGPAGRGAGWSIDMSANGARVVIGGPGVGSVNGVVIAYELISNVWVALGTPIAGNHELGYAVAMSDDGNRIALSAPSSDGSIYAGSTFVYDYNGSNWTQVGATIVGEATGNFAGGALSLSADGAIIAIGAEHNVGAGAGSQGGHVRVYRLTSGVWTQVGSDIDGPDGSSFGTSVALSADGNRLIAGGPSPGLVRLYTLTSGAWVLNTEPTFVADRRVGSSVAISPDGRFAATGAEYGDGVAGNASGIVRVYSLPAP